MRYYLNELRYHKASVAVHGDNEPSLRLHDKRGFTREGLFRRHIFSSGGYIDLVWYGMCDDDMPRLWP